MNSKSKPKSNQTKLEKPKDGFLGIFCDPTELEHPGGECPRIAEPRRPRGGLGFAAEALALSCCTAWGFAFRV